MGKFMDSGYGYYRVAYIVSSYVALVNCISLTWISLQTCVKLCIKCAHVLECSWI